MSIDCVGVCACHYLNYGSILLRITWVITRPPIKQDLAFPLGFVTMYIVASLQTEL